jgi:hypothetical protein
MFIKCTNYIIVTIIIMSWIVPCVFADPGAMTHYNIAIDPFVQKNFALGWWSAPRTFMKRILLNPSLSETNSIQTGSGGVYSQSIDGTLKAVTAEYDWSIKRWQLKAYPNFYYYLGEGILISGGYYDNNSKIGSYSIGTGFAVPVGLEWFGIRNIPNLSFMLEARPTAAVSYSRVSNSQTDNNSGFGYQFSVIPQLFISYYF